MRHTIPVLNRMSDDISTLMKELSLLKKALSLLDTGKTSSLDPFKIQLIESLRKELQVDLLSNLVRSTPHVKNGLNYELRKKPDMSAIKKEFRVSDLDRSLDKDLQIEMDRLLKVKSIDLTKEELERLSFLKSEITRLNREKRAIRKEILHNS